MKILLRYLMVLGLLFSPVLLGIRPMAWDKSVRESGRPAGRIFHMFCYFATYPPDNPREVEAGRFTYL